MMNDALRAEQPRRAGICDALARAFPPPGSDAEEREERRILRRPIIKEALK